MGWEVERGPIKKGGGGAFTFTICSHANSEGQGRSVPTSSHGHKKRAYSFTLHTSSALA